LMSGPSTSIKAIAKKDHVDSSDVSRMIHLTTLAPDIIAAILDDQVPPAITLEQLISGLPVEWEVQRGRFGFEND
jgi:hypothetical protein